MYVDWNIKGARFSRLICGINVTKINERSVQRRPRNDVLGQSVTDRVPDFRLRFYAGDAIDLARGWTVDKKTITTNRPVDILSSLQLRIHSFYATENCFWGADKCPIKSDCRFPPRGGKVVDSIKPVENFDRQRYKVESPDQETLFVFSFLRSPRAVSPTKDREKIYLAFLRRLLSTNDKLGE